MRSKSGRTADEGKTNAKSVFDKSNDFVNSLRKKKAKKKGLGKLSKAFSGSKVRVPKSISIPVLAIFAIIIVSILLSTVFVPMNMLFSNPQDLRSTQQKIRAALIEDFDKTNMDNTMATYLEKTYHCKNMYYGGNDFSKTRDKEKLSNEKFSRSTRVLVNVDNPEDGNTCYVEVTYKNLKMFNEDNYTEEDSTIASSDDDPDITADEIVYAYASAVNTVIDMFGKSETISEGDLGSITPSTNYGLIPSTLDSSTTVYMSGYYNEDSLRTKYINSDFIGMMPYVNDEQSASDFKEIMGLPGYDEHMLGNTISIQWQGENAPETTVRASVDADGEATGNEFEVSAACIADPNYGSTCTNFYEYEAAKNHTYYKKDDGKFYYNNATASGRDDGNSNLRCGNYHSAGNEACFADEKVQKTFKIAVDNGFVLRYPLGKENETGHLGQYWTFTYVGKDDAKAIYNNGDWLTLESYYGVSGSRDYENSDVTVDENYKSGDAGGTDDALETGVANKSHYISSDKKPDLVKCGSVELTEGACSAFKEFQTAVKDYKEDDTSEEDASKEDITEAQEIPEKSLFNYENKKDEDGNEYIDTTLTEDGKAYIDKGKSQLTDSTDEDLVKDIKASATGVFSIEQSKGVNKYTETDHKTNQVIYRANRSAPDMSKCKQIDTGAGGIKYEDDNTCMTQDVTSWSSVLVDDTYSVDVPLKIDLRSYKKQEIQDTIEKAKEMMVNQGRCVYTDDPDELKIFNEDTASLECTDDEVEHLFWMYVGYYYNMEIGVFGAQETKTFYDDNGNQYSNIFDDGTEFSVDGVEGNQCLYTRIIQGMPTTKSNPTTVLGAGVEAPEEIASIPEGTVYAGGTSENYDFFSMISTSIPYYYGGQCTDFVWWRFKLQYGLDTGGGNGKDVAANTAAKYPGQFQLVEINSSNYMDVNESYAGSIISQPIVHDRTGRCMAGTNNVGHVLFLEKVDTSSGEPIIWYSEGNFAPKNGASYGDIRINMRQSLAKFLADRCGVLDLCVPIAS